MTDHIIKAAKAAGFSTIQFKGDVERIRVVHSNGSWVCCTDSVTALYAIAYRAGMERAAEIAMGMDCAMRCRVGHEVAAAIRAEAHAQNQPKNVHDTGNVSKN